MDDSFWFLVILNLLAIYILVLHVRWRKKMRVYAKKLKDEESQLIHLEKMASLGTLSAGIAHEINNPLTFLITNLDLLTRYTREAQVTGEFRFNDMEETLDECREGTQRIKRIVQDLLSFSHPSQGKKMLVDINELLDVTVRILWNEIKYKVDVVKDYQSQAKLWVDPTQLSQVFLNLVLNAVQSIRDKGTVRINTTEDDTNVTVTVSDTGCGISKEVLSEIFTPFYTTKGGPGLGLSVSKGIIENYRGTIEVDSKVGQGTTFKVSFPKEDKK